MSCESVRPRLEAYLDGELPDAELASLEAHLAGCPACARAALAGRELRAAIREAGTGLVPRPALRARVERTLGRGGSAHALSRWLPLAAALAASLLVGAGLALLLARPRTEPGLREAVDLHVSQLASTVPLDVVSTDAHTVKPWFEGKVPFTFDLPDLAKSPFELLGGRVVYLDQAPAAHLLFRVRRHRISCFVRQERFAADVAGAADARSFRVVSFRSRGLLFTLVADTGAEDLEALARLLRSGGSGS